MDDAQSQFVADSQEIVERLFRDLEQLRGVRLQGPKRRELAARIFRRVHTLKGSAGSFGLKTVTRVAHEFEGVLDGVRLGRITIDDSLLDLFEDATNAIAQALTRSSTTESDSNSAALIKRLNSIAITSTKQGKIASGLRSALPAEIARALSEYDLQHAREAVREGATLFIVSAGLPIETFDEAFRALSKLLGQSGEIIATVPGEPASADEINFRLLYAAELVSPEVTRRASEFGRVEVSTVKIETPAIVEKAPVETSNAQSATFDPRASVRVELDQLDELISDASELFRDTNNALVSFAGPANKEAVEAAASHLRRRFVELEERLIKLRLIPLADILERAAARAGRIAARQLEKEVEFEIVGGEVEIDKSLADAIAEPLLHLVRNAVGHGIETPEERNAAGKSATGKVKLAAFNEGSRIQISVSDDGRGIDLNRIASAASAHGIADQGSTLTMDQCLRLIFRPGFSTTTEVSELSGRGIGLDVVDRAMAQAGGEVRVVTEAGAGTTFVMILPAAL
ncbi:MAG TPA: ATP-binding protein, partial [Pyrinomonadaceae bacterium]|nr:ATP-binding protein [Pyrinomonadaceae bacterium]